MVLPTALFLLKGLPSQQTKRSSGHLPAEFTGLTILKQLA